MRSAGHQIALGLWLIAGSLLIAKCASADGLAAMLMPADPCGPYAPAIVEVDSVAQADLYAMNCGIIPTVAQMVALDQNYVPGDKAMHWAVPDLLPAPSPVPIPGSLGFLSIAMFALWGVKRRMRNV